MLWILHLRGTEMGAFVMLLCLTQTVGFKRFLFVYLKIMYSENLCNQRCSEELQLFSCNEDKPMLMLFKMDENVTI